MSTDTNKEQIQSDNLKTKSMRGVASDVEFNKSASIHDFDIDIRTQVEGVPDIAFLTPNHQRIECFGQPTITIGRADTKHKIFPTMDLGRYGGHEHGVSRIHAKIIFRDTGFYVIDLNSSNGTQVNEYHVTPRMPHRIKAGDIIQLGYFPIEVLAVHWN